MDNYFNYFTEIEEHFQKRRGILMILSPLDWALMETWKDAGVPLEAVVRGIDASFDKWERKPRRTRKVNSLAYCAQEVLASAEELKDSAVGAAIAKPTAGLELPEVVVFLRRNADALEHANLPSPADVIAQETIANLRALADAVEQGTAPSMEDIERRMTVGEEKLLAALLASTPEDALFTVRREADRDLAPYRSKMTAPQIEQLHRQYVQKRLLEQHHVPRLSLFYM